MNQNWIVKVILLLIVFTGAGCGGGVGAPRLFPVSGSLKVKGDPIADVRVVLFPVKDSNKTGVVATGITDSKGQFNLASPSGTGAPAGNYKVVLTMSRPLTNDEMTKLAKQAKEKERIAKGPPQSGPPSSFPMSGPPGRGQTGGAPPAMSGISGPFPQEYSSADTSPTGFEVKRGAATLDLNL